MAWRCAKCGADSQVTESRPRDGFVMRRRKCLQCGERWTTREYRSESTLPLTATRDRLAKLEKKITIMNRVRGDNNRRLDIAIRNLQEARRRNTAWETDDDKIE